MTEHNTQTAVRPDAPQHTAPLAVRNAARVMYAGAVASVARGVVYLVTERATKAALEHRFPRLSAATITTLTHATVIAGAVKGVVGALLFVWIARECLERNAGHRSPPPRSARSASWARSSASTPAGARRA